MSNIFFSVCYLLWIGFPYKLSILKNLNRLLLFCIF